MMYDWKIIVECDVICGKVKFLSRTYFACLQVHHMYMVSLNLCCDQYGIWENWLHFLVNALVTLDCEMMFYHTIESASNY